MPNTKPYNLTFTDYYNFLKYGSYIAVKPTKNTTKTILEIINKLKLKSPIKEDDLHVTLMYSDTRGIPEFFPYTNAVYNATGYKLEVWDNVLVMTLESPELHSRFDDLSYRGFRHSYDTYVPHISLSYEYQGEKIDKDIAANIKLEFSNEYHETLKDT